MTSERSVSVLGLGAMVSALARVFIKTDGELSFGTVLPPKPKYWLLQVRSPRLRRLNVSVHRNSKMRVILTVNCVDKRRCW
ncbi:hypothetical protein BDV29DRAFT_171154 [Aspergillus leporis]|uniref:Uncharacterized protein n=1 Tax=Aspergillus leporis TaxID=41062 RepID=A0A5N5X512_9EURO|nr:hypothetical protein BDV29DRAFT_171154 [Aspergillus leporis]